LDEIIGGKIATASRMAVRDLREFVIKDIDDHICTLAANVGLMGLERGGTANLRPMPPKVATKGSSLSFASVLAALLAVRDDTRINNPRVCYVRFARVFDVLCSCGLKTNSSRLAEHKCCGS